MPPPPRRWRGACRSTSHGLVEALARLMAMHVCRSFLKKSVGFSLFKRRENGHGPFRRCLWREFHGHPRAWPCRFIDEVNVQRMLQVKMKGVIVRHIGLTQVAPPLGSLPAAGNLGLQSQHGTHRCTPFCRRRLAQVLFQERKDFLPPIDRLLLPIGGAIIVEEAVAGTIISVELVGFAVLL